VDPIDEAAAKARVQEALWAWFQRALVLAVAFGFGFFAAWLAYGSGTQGAPALRTLTKEQAAQIVELKNNKIDIQGQLEVTSGRLQRCETEKQKRLTEAAECKQKLLAAGIEP
jgi:hypothetical protein